MSSSDPAASPAVLVTGTSTGIGRTTTRLLDREGWQVYAGVRRGEDAESLRGECSSRVTPLLLDVTQASAIEQAAKDVAEALGEAPLVGIVNNAGIGFGGPLEFIDLEEMRNGFEVNVFGLLAVTRTFLPLVRRGSGGRIVNVSSGAGKVAMPFLGPYCASKFAVEALSDAMRLELRGGGIRVSVVEPGFIDTPMQEKGQGDVERMRATLSEDGRLRYDHGIDQLAANLERFAKSATPPRSVARAIFAALTAKRPKSRYTVGTDARLLSPLSRLLPDGAKDALLGKLHDL